MPGANVLAPWMTPHRLTSMMRRHPSQSPSVELAGPTPALFISTATGPNFEVAARSSASTSPSRLTSVGAASTPLAPFGETAATSRPAFSSAAPGRSAMTTLSPIAAKRFAAARPMPDAPPVTTAQLPAEKGVSMVIVVS